MNPRSITGCFVVAVIAVVYLFAFTLPPAHAARGVTYDPRGDAVAGFDILRVVALNGKRKLALKIVYRGSLKPRYEPGLGVSAHMDLDLGAPAESVYDNDFAVGASFGVPNQTNRFYFMRGYHMARCPGLKGRVGIKRGVIRLVVPQRCFRRQAGRVRVAGFTYANKGVGRSADYIRKWGRWVERG